MKITNVRIITEPAAQIIQGEAVTVKALLYADDSKRTLGDGSLKLNFLEDYKFEWKVGSDGSGIREEGPGIATWTPASAGKHVITLNLSHDSPGSETLSGLKQPILLDVSVAAAPTAVNGPMEVRLMPSVSSDKTAAGFLQAIIERTSALDFSNYQIFVDRVMCPNKPSLPDNEMERFNEVNRRRASVFPGVDAYQRLKVATEVFLMLNVRVLKDYKFSGFDPDKFETTHGVSVTLNELQGRWTNFLTTNDSERMLPIDNIIRSRLKEPLIEPKNGDVTACEGILAAKLRSPCFIELIWSYWHEEGMLVQTMKSIALRFQNQRTSERDPLASFDIAPLYPLSNILWGYIQDEQHRLTVSRRAYEYDHHYGIMLDGKAVQPLRSADSRSKFIEAFHNLLHGAQLFYKQDDDTTKRADGFPVLNGLKEVHLLLREGMHNQFGDLPSTARMEMLMEQWILARPEMQEFLGGRAMMPYSEDWMDRVDTMKKLKGWTDVSVTYFNELAEFGELLLTSIRHYDWSNTLDAGIAVFWARGCRSAIQQYVHSYRTVTGVDLSVGQADVRLAADRYLQPSVLLRKRLDAQWQQIAAAGPAFGSPRRAAAAGAGRNVSHPSSARRNGVGKGLEFSEEIE